MNREPTVILSPADGLQRGVLQHVELAGDRRVIRLDPGVRVERQPGGGPLPTIAA